MVGLSFILLPYKAILKPKDNHTMSAQELNGGTVNQFSFGVMIL
jgi:hypothetical protein